MSRRGLRTVLIIVGAIAGAAVIARRLGYNLGANTVVRCRQGHLFTTIWIPGVKFKELDLVVARVQRCPVGNHWSLVVPVRDADLTDEERQFAREHHDIHIPLRKPAARNGAPGPWPRRAGRPRERTLMCAWPPRQRHRGNRPDEDARTLSRTRKRSLDARHQTCGLTKRYRPGHRVVRLLHRRPRGPDIRAGRAERRGQDHAAPPALLASRRTVGCPPRRLR